MPKDQLIAEVNQDMREAVEHLEGSREHPGLIRVAKALIRLTNTPEQNAADAETASKQPDPKQAVREALAKQIGDLKAKLESL
jgi:hypothetical protein